MLTKYFAVIIITGLIVLIIPAHAVQLDTAIPKNSTEFVPVFTFTKIISFQYDEESKLAELFGSTQQKISFDIDSQNGKVLIEKINYKLKEKSFVTVTDIVGKYVAVITPQKESASIEYKITLQPTMQGHFISDSILDSQWRGFQIDEKIPIETEFGIYDINSPISAFIKIPQVIEYISESAAMELLKSNLVDTTGLVKLPLSKWESMFDPTAKMSETASYGFSGTVITNYSMGICTVYLGFCEDRDYTVPFEIDEEKYIVRSIESQDDGTIIIEGYVQESTLDKIEVFQVGDAPARGDENDTQVPILYMVSGLGVAMAVGFFVWSDKKSKKTSSEQTGIDPKDLCAAPIGDSAGSYQTNRATAHLR
jgi:hypothetical protein